MIIKKRAILSGYIFKRIPWTVGERRCGKCKPNLDNGGLVCFMCDCIGRATGIFKENIHWNYIYYR